MIRNGDVEFKAREEEIRFLKMEVRPWQTVTISFNIRSILLNDVE